MGKIARAIGYGLRPGRQMSRLHLGTSLSGTAAALLIGIMPANAATPPLMTLGAISLASTSVTVPAILGTPLPQDLTRRHDPDAWVPASVSPVAPRGFAISNSVAPNASSTVPLPHDLTIAATGPVTGSDVVVNAGTIATTGYAEHGIDTFATRTTTISADGITTSGDGADGVHSVGYGDIAIKTGNVATSGYRSNGIYANTNLGGATGGITIAAEQVSTAGTASAGINAEAYHGAVAVTVGSVKTGGNGSDGIAVASFDNDATVNASTVATTGEGSRGIVAYSGGTTTVIADTVSTSGAGTGTEYDAGAIRAVGAAVTVQAGTVSTKGDYSAGIYAGSNLVHDNGQAARDLTITASTVTTQGFGSDGIDAVNSGKEGNISISADTVSTSGDHSWGVYASNSGDVTPGTQTDVAITVGSVTTKGFAAYGVYAVNLSEGGSSHISAGSVSTAGAYSNAISSVTRGDAIISAGTVSTAGYGSAGVFAYAETGNVSVDVGSASTSGDNGFGIFSVTRGGSVSIDAGDVETSGVGSVGIAAQSHGDIDILAGNVTATGAYSGGIIAQADNNIALNAGSVATSGDLSIGIIANSLGFHETDVTVGDITTSGALSSGVLATGGTTNVTVTGQISTSGTSAAGVQIYGKEAAHLLNSGTIATSGDYTALGVLITSPNGNVTVDGNGSISTSGRYSDGLFASTYTGDITIAQQAVTTSGYHANAINAYVENYYAVPRSGDIKIDVDTVATQGDQSTAILARDYNQGSIAMDVASASTKGDRSNAIVAVAGKGANDGDITIHAGTVATTGDYSNGIVTVATGSTTITADSVTTSGSHSAGIHVYGYGPISINAGSVTTAGYRADGIYANNNLGHQSGGIEITAGTVSTAGDASTAIRALGYQGDTNITATSVQTSGIGSDGIYAWSYLGNANVKVGTVSTTGDSGRGIVAYSGGTTTVIADSVTTSGEGFSTSTDAAAIKAVGAAVDVQVGSVSTSGDYSAGIYANSNFTHDNGQAARGIAITAGTVSTGGYGSDGIDAIDIGRGGNISVTADAVYTQGGKAFGIYARSLYGDVDVALGTVATGGYASPGVIAISDHGNVSVTAGSVTTYGDNSPGVYAATVIRGPNGTYSIGGKAAVTVGTVTTHGYFSNAVYAIGGSAEVTVNGGITTYGTASRGVVAIAVTGDAAVHNEGAILTNGYGAGGVLAEGYGNVVVDGGGTVETHGDFAGAVTVASVGGGSVTIDAGSVLTVGRKSNGIYALARNNYGDTSGDVTITAGDVTTRGYQSRGIVALNFNQGGNITIADTGTVSTHDDGGYGIVAIAPYGSVAVDANAVATRGGHADDIYAIGGAGIAIKAGGSLSSLGDYADGIFAANYSSAAAAKSDVSITVGGISTAGYKADGILALNYAAGGDIDIAVDDVTASGKGSKGIYAVDPSGAVTITAGTVSTTGAFLPGTSSTPFSRSSAITAVGSSVSITAGAVSTTGNYAYGVKAISLGGLGSVKIGSISTTGDYAEGVRVSSYGSADVTVGAIASSGHYDRGVTIGATEDVSVLVTGPVKMTGSGSSGIFASSSQGSVSVTTQGTVDVVGRSSVALQATSTGGSVSVEAKDKVSITGFNIAGIVASAAAPSGDSGPQHGAAKAAAMTAVAPGITVRAGDVSALGTITTGIAANDDFGGLVDITANSVTSTDRGIIAESTGAVAIKVGSVTSGLMAIQSLAAGDNAVTISGAVRATQTTAVLASSANGDVTVNVGSDGSIVGGGKARTDTLKGYYGDGVSMYVAHGTATLNNAGTIATDGDGYAVHVLDQADEIPDSRGRATITNTGTIVGAVRLTGGDDVLTNSGLFVATKDSDFGGGIDLLVNSGTLRVLADTKIAGHVTMLGLEKFANSGLVDLRNGHSGDTLTLPGSYVGSGGAMLGLDFSATTGIADQLVVGGAATGSTAIVLDANGSDATLLARPIALVKVGTGSSANAFTLATPEVGFVHYDLAFDAASGSFGLSSRAGSAVSRLGKATEAAQSIWRKSADAWATHMAELRDGARPDQRVWGQAYGAVDNRHGHEGSNDVGYRQDYYGFQAGVDLAGKSSEDGNGVVFGLTGGYLSSKVNFRAGAERLRFDTVDLGGYAAFRAGPFFANLLGQYDHYRIDARNGGEHWNDRVNGDGYGAQAEVGARLGHDSLFVEPVASLSWQKTDLGTLHALGQSIDFGHGSALTGKLGLRVGGTSDMGGGNKAVFYARANFVHSLHGRGSALLESGGTSDAVKGAKLGDHGEGALGVNLLTTGRLSGFIEGDADAGGGLKGGGGRAGIRLKL